jgi:hypothetical protein
MVSNDALLVVPGSVVIAGGATAASFYATAGRIGTDQSATVTAMLGNVSKTASLALLAPSKLSGLACTPTSIAVGATATCTLTMTGSAGNVSVVIASGKKKSLSAPGSVLVPFGTNHATFAVQALSPGSVTLSATLGSVTKTVSLSVSPH